ncbi:BZ3500_MvSof-1268-A1-R1_Chr8-2g10163 [Microbotryum saponariae]|uniref:BZ3500_MvSof-1268-A1-R1_Chr8-2g10163 protein n=1 Tax=Microbotryum saponariae TaxID=289078 RepID=A0A2X0MPZ1_9BASI|nr:BZ3500_MvSof-1268-A1-R1_Chr8-2g10163 [Microbotryum saponariae]SDA01909.1 BZ3501_MvSof-1269-A2-R1_Chr8-2g09914 [Microbotryum saponariae]
MALGPHRRASARDLLGRLSALFDSAAAQASGSNSTAATSVTVSASSSSTSYSSTTFPTSSPFPTLRTPASLEASLQEHINTFASTFPDSAHEAKERERTRWRDGLLELWASAEPRAGTETEPQAVARVSAFLVLLCQLSADGNEYDDSAAIVTRHDIAKVWWGAVLRRVILGSGKDLQRNDDRTTAAPERSRGRKSGKSEKGKDTATPSSTLAPAERTITSRGASGPLLKPLTVSREALEASTTMVVWGMSPTQEESDQEWRYVPPFFLTVRDEYEQRALTGLKGFDEGYGVRNLQECLINWGEKFYVRLFEQMAPFVTVSRSPQLPTLSLLVAFLSRHPDKAKGIHETPLLGALITLCLTSRDSASVILGVKCLVISLVQLTVLIGDHLPGLFAIYARLVCWERPDDLLEDAPLEDTDGSPIISVETPDSMLLFSCLYGIFPCNFTAFLRDATGYLRSKNWSGPLEAYSLFDTASVRAFSKPLIARHTLHPALLSSDPASELTDVTRFGDADAAGVMALCDQMVVHEGPGFVSEVPTTPRPSRGRRAASGLAVTESRPGSLRPSQIRKASTSGSRSRSPIPHLPLATHFTNFQARQNSGSTLLKSVPTSRSGSRPRTPITDLADHSHPAWSGLIPSSTDSSTQASSSSSRASSINGSPSTIHGTLNAPAPVEHLESRPRSRFRGVHVPGGVQASKLERDIALLQGEVDFQRYLKQIHLQYMGTLHRQKVLGSGAEAERQALNRTIRTLKAQLKQIKSSLDQLRNESSTIKVNWVSHIDDLREKLKTVRESKGKADQEGKTLRAQLEVVKEREAKLQKELDTTGAEFLDLRNQVALDSEKLSRLEEYEKRIGALTKAVAISDADLIKFKEQKRQMDLLAAKAQKSEMLRESIEAEAATLRQQLRVKDDELAKLRQANPIALSSAIAATTLTKDDHSKLLEELERLRTKNQELVVQVMELQQEPASRHGSVHEGHSDES